MSKVYFTAVKESDDAKSVCLKLERLLDASGTLEFLRKKDKVAVKIHFGEEGNTGHIKPAYAGTICSKIKDKGAEPFLTDTNALYKGQRTVAEDHLRVARKHGFTKDSCGAEVVIAGDGKDDTIDVKTDGKFFKIAKISKLFLKSDAVVSAAHFKGHLFTGFGGAIKNIGMGCATREGKLAQHSEIAPVIYAKICVKCMKCAEACPAGAITLKEDKVYIDPSKCIGCASCIAACNNSAIGVDWEAGGSMLQEKMVEYAGAVLKNRSGKTAFINFAIKITKECDCLAGDDPRISPDVGIFASADPVSIDKASFDAVVKACGKDIFKLSHPGRDGSKQLKYAESLSLGEMDYKLIEV